MTRIGQNGRERVAVAAQILLPSLIPIAAVVYLWGENAEVVRAVDALDPLAIAMFATLVAQVILTALTRQVARSALTIATLAFVAVVFGYQLDAASELIEVEPATIQGALVLADIVLVAIALWLIWRSSLDAGRVALGGAIVVALFILLSAPNIATSFRWSDATKPADEHRAPATVVAPDIYYLVLDGYGRDDVLAEVYGFDNGLFLGWLEERGFYIARDALANYTRTHLSMASSLNLRYLDDELPPNLTPQAVETLTRLLHESVALTTLQDYGYSYVHFETIWWGTASAPQADIRFETGADSEFEAVFLHSTLPGRLLPLPTWQEEHLRTLSHLPEVADLPQPTVTLAHVLLPHPPFVFDEHGRQVRRGAELGGSWSDRDAYIDQLQFTNSWIESTVADILARSEVPPIIILQGDHGPWSTAGLGSSSSLSRWERTSILNAYLVPPELRDELYPSISPVNTFRLLLSGLFEEDTPLLPDRAMFSPNDTDPLIDVTDELRGR